MPSESCLTPNIPKGAWSEVDPLSPLTCVDLALLPVFVKCAITCV